MFYLISSITLVPSPEPVPPPKLQSTFIPRKQSVFSISLLMASSVNSRICVFQRQYFSVKEAGLILLKVRFVRKETLAKSSIFRFLYLSMSRQPQDQLFPLPFWKYLMLAGSRYENWALFSIMGLRIFGSVSIITVWRTSDFSRRRQLVSLDLINSSWSLLPIWHPHWPISMSSDPMPKSNIEFVQLTCHYFLQLCFREDQLATQHIGANRLHVEFRQNASRMAEAKMETRAYNISLMSNRRESYSPPPMSQQLTSPDYNYYYYEEYKKLYVASFMLSTQMKELLKTKDELVNKLTRLEVATDATQKKTEDFNDDFKGSSEQKKKRNRRPASEITRNYQCVVEKCHKLYGTQGSLHQHIKLKHPEIYAGESISENAEVSPS